MSIRFDVIEQLSHQPTLRSVASDRLRRVLPEYFPALVLDPDYAAVSPTQADRSPAFVTLTDCALNAFSTQMAPGMAAGSHRLISNIQQPSASALAADMALLSSMIGTVADELLDSFCQALVDFWSTAVNDGRGRWHWLGKTLNRRLIDALRNAEHAALSRNQRQALRLFATFPEKWERDLEVNRPTAGAGQTLLVQLAQLEAPTLAGRPQPMLAALILSGQMDGQPVHLLYHPSGQVSSYASQALLLEAQRGDRVGPLSWRLYAPESDCFESLALIMLGSQLDAVGAIKGASRYVLADVEHYLASATDIGRMLAFEAGTHGTLTFARLPDWLRRAAPLDRVQYSRALAAVAVIQRRDNGKAFNDGLPPILSFTTQALEQRFSVDHPEFSGLKADDIELDITQSVAGAFPSQGQVVSVGEVQVRRLSLPEYALENLAGKPGRPVSIRRKSALPLPEAFTVAYLNELTTAVNVGATYPALLRSTLIEDKAEAARREKLFSDQLAVQLPLKALEQKIRQEGAVTQAGVDCVVALMKPAGQRGDVVLRPLGFVSRIGARPDVVGNMFVIGAEATERGPFLLYRPFHRVPLRQYASWSGLLAAIIENAELQRDVLDWLSDQARPIYANGGFAEPHIVRFGQGSEFSLIETPAPAALAEQSVSGEPLATLFAVNAQALVSLADRSSVSNAERRWANLKEGGWLLLNAVLPMITGPVANAAWLAQLLISVDGVLKAEDTLESQSRALADLLLNISLLLLHHGLSSELLALRSPLGAPISKSEGDGDREAQAVLDTAPLPDDPNAVLDFSWSSATHSLTREQSSALANFAVTPAPVLGEPLSDGIYQGLYRHEGVLYVRLYNLCYRVSVDDDRARIIGPGAHPVPGPFLVYRDGGWHVDASLKLRGGSPGKSALKIKAENDARKVRAQADRLVLQKLQKRLVLEGKALETDLYSLADDERQGFIDRYEAQIEQMLELQRAHIAQCKKLRVNDLPSRESLAKDQMNASRAVSLLELQLMRSVERIERHELKQLGLETQSRVTLENVKAFLALFDRLQALLIKGRHWVGVRDQLWREVLAVPGNGMNAIRADIQTIQDGLFTEFEWHAAQVLALQELSLGAEQLVAAEGQQNSLTALRNDDSLRRAFASHGSLGRSNTYTLAEKIGVLETALGDYTRVIDISQSVQTSATESVDGNFLKQFLTEIEGIAAQTEARLSTLIRESKEPAEEPSVWLPKMTGPVSRVITTRNQRTLVGRVRQNQSQQGQVVDITDPMSDEVIGSYHQAEEGDWVAVEAAPEPAPAVAPKALPLGTLRNNARTLLADVEPAIKNAQRQALTAYEPQDMEDILLQRAEKLTALGNRLETFSSDPALEESIATQLATLLAEVRSAATRLTNEGRSLRISMIKAQPPTAARVRYLQQQGEVVIASVGKREPRGDGFLQEYVVRDNHHKDLWWAHFHYPNKQIADDAFTVAHLKTPEQRLLRYQQVLDAALNNRQVVSVYRSGITKAVAQQVFLPFAPKA